MTHEYIEKEGIIKVGRRGKNTGCNTRPHLQEGAGISIVGDSLKVDLRYQNNKRTHTIQWDQNSLNSLPEILPAGPGFQRIPGTHPGEQKEEGHDPQIKQADEHIRDHALLRVIEMPAPAAEEPGAVEQEHGQHCSDP